MSNTFRTLDHADVKGKRVLMRVDLNVPYENGVVSDATRIERIAPSITELADKGAKVILLSHFGRPKGKDASQSLKPVAAEVAHTIKRPIKFVGDCIGEEAERRRRCTGDEEHRGADGDKQRTDQQQISPGQTIHQEDGGHCHDKGNQAEEEDRGAAVVREAIPPEEEANTANQCNEGEGGGDDNKGESAQQELPGHVNASVAEQ